MGVPVYIVSGFLDSGKTTFINTMLEDPDFNDGERTLLIRCEEGEEEYDPAALAAGNAVVKTLEDDEEMEEGALEKLDEEFMPERIILEYNGMWLFDQLYDAPKPESWELAQVVTCVNGQTFELFMTNMATQMSDAIRQADLVIFNRTPDPEKRKAFARRVMALNNAARIFFENPDGNMEEADSEPPIDMTLDPLQVDDDSFGAWYLDAMQHPERYDGRKIKLHGLVMYLDGTPKNTFILARRAMTCCADDIAAIGFLCQWTGAMPAKGSWVNAVAKCEKSFSPLHNADCMILIGDKVMPASPAKDDLVYFN